MKKERILSEIKRTAKENGGVPLGIDRFREETGIEKKDWYGIIWTKWSDAQKEAGFEPNQFSLPAFDEEWMIKKIIDYTRELGNFPTKPELKIKRRSDKNFPNITTIRNRLGNKPELVSRILNYCTSQGNCQDIIDICLPLKDSFQSEVEKQEEPDSHKVGYVYLIKHGNRNEYKIGKTYNLIRREGEIRLELPEEITPIHTIETDDPSGIERYWHNRFADKRKEGEWFRLNTSDVRAFKKWKKIY